MTRTVPLFVGALVGVLLWVAPVAARKPNIVLLVADDLGYGELGCQGNPQIPTPHIDSLARNGVRFTSGYVTAPFCSPSRAGLMTGRYQTRFGHELNVIGKRNLDEQVGLPLSETTLADRLNAAGYATGLVGKWHLGGAARYHPRRRGFDAFFGFLHEGHFYVPPPYAGVTSHLRPKEPPYDADNPILRDTQPVEEKAYMTEALTREAVAFIDRHQKEPFFLYLAYNAVHSPMQATPKYLDRFRSIADEHRRVFAAMLAAMDDSIGAVLARLREAGLEEDTLVFFLSDNGGPTAELTSSNRPLRGGKGQLYEGGVRVPFLIQWKGRVPAGKTFDAPVTALDIVPTTLAAAGVVPPSGLDGADLLPHLAGRSERVPHETLYWRFGPNAALRKGDWKLVRQTERGGRAASFQLFDLSKDLGETTDLSGQRPEARKELEAAWRQWDAQMVEPLWTPAGAKAKGSGS